MDDMQFSAETHDDLEEAYEHSNDAYSAIEALQATDLWPTLPIETRRVLCAAHAHLDALAGALYGVI